MFPSQALDRPVGASALVDTSVLVDYLERERAAAPLYASEVTRLEVLAGVRARDEAKTRSLLSALVWHPVDEEVAEKAGCLGRRWLPSDHGIDSADLAIAATAIHGGWRLLTGKVRHFPMFSDLRPPY